MPRVESIRPIPGATRRAGSRRRAARAPRRSRPFRASWPALTPDEALRVLPRERAGDARERAGGPRGAERGSSLGSSRRREPQPPTRAVRFHVAATARLSLVRRGRGGVRHAHATIPRRGVRAPARRRLRAAQPARVGPRAGGEFPVHGADAEVNARSRTATFSRTLDDRPDVRDTLPREFDESLALFRRGVRHRQGEGPVRAGEDRPARADARGRAVWRWILGRPRAPSFPRRSSAIFGAPREPSEDARENFARETARVSGWRGAPPRVVRLDLERRDALPDVPRGGGGRRRGRRGRRHDTQAGPSWAATSRRVGLRRRWTWACARTGWRARGGRSAGLPRRWADLGELFRGDGDPGADVQGGGSSVPHGEARAGQRAAPDAAAWRLIMSAAAATSPWKRTSARSSRRWR